MRPRRFLSFDTAYTFLTCLLGIVRSSLQQGQIDNINAYENFTIASVGRFIEAQVGHAQINDILPTGSAPNLQPPDARPYKLFRCRRVDVTKCVRAGESPCQGACGLYSFASWPDAR